jgi:hypothetical protein
MPSRRVAVGRIENADHSGTPNDRLGVERQPKLHVRIHGRRLIAWEQCLRPQARNAESLEENNKHARLEKVAHQVHHTTFKLTPCELCVTVSDRRKRDYTRLHVFQLFQLQIFLLEQASTNKRRVALAVPSVPTT